ncbi:biotin--[acetyl-CoA-carboxylase] ligase [Blattabacterium cuenoti]|uniref:biotin--[acetyl-CoA-carboxylase] ligase n=1 Tax=Blattabacterium cuenoti TaxID=1653831 RepID=UPI00163B9275|nr:biotin--[acetyl-CoA-carboxylase] ligase [Blattabacterium cuenoti]
MKKLIWPIHLILLKKINSTNQYAKKYINIWNNWTVIWTMNQTNGNGVGKNIWHSEKYKNLTFSIILKPIVPLSIEKKYIINIIISNAIQKILSYHYSNDLFSIKWPNDIILDNKKIGGILIENNVFSKKIYLSIIGIGLNINQTEFDEKWKATSLKKNLKVNSKLDYLFYEMILSIQKEYFLYIKFGEVFIRKYYINNLFLKNKSSLFYYKKKIFLGIIKSITNKGLLIIEYNKKYCFFFEKEIKIIM